MSDYDLNYDPEAELNKLDAQMAKLREERAKLKEKLEADKLLLDLAKRIGIIVLNEFQGKQFMYSSFENILEEKLILDFDRQFFGLRPLPLNDPRRPKRRGGRKKKSESLVEDDV